ASPECGVKPEVRQGPPVASRSVQRVPPPEWPGPPGAPAGRTDNLGLAGGVVPVEVVQQPLQQRLLIAQAVMELVADVLRRAADSRGFPGQLVEIVDLAVDLLGHRRLLLGGA